MLGPVNTSAEATTELLRLGSDSGRYSTAFAGAQAAFQCSAQ